MKKIQFIPAAFLTIAAAGLQAQPVLQNNGTLYVAGSGILYSTGSFTNASTGVLTNNGSLYLLQDLTNHQAGMAAGTGILHLNGISAQSIGGTQPFRTFNLESNNSVGITLNNDLSVGGTHTFTAGII